MGGGPGVLCQVSIGDCTASPVGVVTAATTGKGGIVVLFTIGGNMRFCRLAISIGLIALLAAILLLGDRRMPTGPDGGGAGQHAAHDRPDTIHVATFNIHGCKGTDGIRDPVRIAELIEGLDLVGVNEVHGAVWDEPRNQAAHLAELAHFPPEDCLFAPAETRWFGAKRFGNGLLTRQPLLSWQRIPLPRRYDHSCRNMLVARIAAPQETVQVLVSHITRSSDREREIQLNAVLDLFASLAVPAILLADLNTPPGDPRMNRFLAETDAVDAIAAGGVSGSERVDWILVRGLQCLDARRIDTVASDHPLFVAELTVPSAP